MQKRAHFSNRIKNLSDLALDGSKEEKTLLFSHIAGLFLQKHPMKSANQDKMFREILNELILDVDISIRCEVSKTLCNMKTPPGQLIQLLSQDVEEVSAPILQNCTLEESHLLELVRYGTKNHRKYIQKRFGLSPLLRYELAKFENNELKNNVTKTTLNKLEKTFVKDEENKNLNPDVISFIHATPQNSDGIEKETNLFHKDKNSTDEAHVRQNITLKETILDNNIPFKKNILNKNTPFYEPSGSIDVIPPKTAPASHCKKNSENLSESINNSSFKNLTLKTINPSTLEKDIKASIFEKVKAKFLINSNDVESLKTSYEKIDAINIPNFLKDLNQAKSGKIVNLSGESLEILNKIPEIKTSGADEIEQVTLQNLSKAIHEISEQIIQQLDDEKLYQHNHSSLNDLTPNQNTTVMQRLKEIRNNPLHKNTPLENSSKITVGEITAGVPVSKKEEFSLDENKIAPEQTPSNLKENQPKAQSKISLKAARITAETSAKHINDEFYISENIKNKLINNFLSSDTGDTEETLAKSSSLVKHSSPSISKDHNENCVNSTADWFWEIDHFGNLQYLSDDAFTAFAYPSDKLIGENLVNLCNMSPIKDVKIQKGLPFETLFGKRASFKDRIFSITSIKGECSYWILSATALFNPSTKCFIGFKGSAKAYIASFKNIEKETTIKQQPIMPTVVDEIEDSLSLSFNLAPNVGLKEDSPSQNYNVFEDEERPQIATSNHISHEKKTYQNNIVRQEIAVSDLLQNLSHELRTPLNAIIGFSEMIEMEIWGNVNEQYLAQTNHILFAARQLKETIDNILDSAKLDAGLMKNNPCNVSLKSILSHTLFSVGAVADRQKIEVSNDGIEFDVILYRDQNAIELCLTKILTRSLLHAREGEKLKILVNMDLQGKVIINVPLLGPALKESEANHIFQKISYPTENEEIINTNTHNKDCMIITPGFGLSVARDLAELIGAKVDLKIKDGFISHITLILNSNDNNFKTTTG